jgi:hypothetical protein
MSGQAHTLTMASSGTELRVTMASGSPGELLAKAETTAGAMEKSEKPPPAAAALRNFIAEFNPKIRALAASTQTAENQERAREQLTRDMAASLVRIGAQFHLTDLGSYQSLGLTDIEMNRLIYGALTSARVKILDERKSASAPPAADEELKTQFNRMMGAATSGYSGASSARIGKGDSVAAFRGNVFSFAGQTYFVDHQHNYILPDSRVGARRGAFDGRVFVASKPALSSLDDLDSDPARSVIEEYAYTGHSHSAAMLAAQARLASLGVQVDPTVGTMFLAAMIAEAARNPNAHVTNLLLMSEESTGSFYRKAPMTGGGTDRSIAPRDPTLRDLPNVERQPPTQVTDAEIALVRGQFEAEGTTLAEVVEHFGVDAAQAHLVEFIIKKARI